MPHPGQLRNVIELQRKSTALDAYGEPIETWSTYATARARIVDGAGAERVLGQQVVAAGAVAFEMRYRNPPPTTEERVRLQGTTRTFDINHVSNVEQRNRWLVLATTEVPS